MLFVLASGVSISETSRPLPIGPPAPKEKEEEPKTVALPNTDDAVKMAWANLQTVPLRDRRFIRYIYNQRGALESLENDSEGMKSTATIQVSRLKKQGKLDIKSIKVEGRGTVYSA